MQQHHSIPRPEHPRPDFRRETFHNLNGVWDFSFDESEKERAKHVRFDRKITVPFVYQCEASGIDTEEMHPVMWYRRSFSVPAAMNGKRIRLCFGAVDYRADVFVNGQLLGSHTGGYTPFSFDITDVLLAGGEQELLVRVEDQPDCSQPRGKQYWAEGLMGCWYTPSSGIWQTVYLESVGDNHFKRISITPDIVNRLARVEVFLDLTPSSDAFVELTLSFQGKKIKSLRVDITDRIAVIPMDVIRRAELDDVYYWTPETPHLYDLQLALHEGGTAADKVSTYFGMRMVEVIDGAVYLNRSQYYQRLVLDQGYWPETLLTPPSDEAIRKDIELTKAFGFNGARKHQKIEDPRYYYWADRLGLIVWGELPSCYAFNNEMIENTAQTMQEFIARDFNHPSIITWVPMNESWGVNEMHRSARQQQTGRMLYYLCKAADGTRLVSSNDGWEQVKTDICALHDYVAEKDDLKRRFESRDYIERHLCDARATYASSETPTGKEAFMLTEFGGIAFSTIGLQEKMGGMETWGYHGKVEDEEAFFRRFEGIVQAADDIAYSQGYCYTQLTDVLQEINGLLTPDRASKVDAQRVCAINQNGRSKR